MNKPLLFRLYCIRFWWVWMGPYLPLCMSRFGINRYLFIKFSAFLFAWCLQQIQDWNINTFTNQWIKDLPSRSLGQGQGHWTNVVAMVILVLRNVLLLTRLEFPWMTLFMMTLKSGTKYLLTIIVSDDVLFICRFLKIENYYEKHNRHIESCIYNLKVFEK